VQKKSILKKTFHFGFFTFISRSIAFFREILQLQFLGTGALADAFIAAFRLPNFFRRIFAEGALSAAFIPTYVQLAKKKNDKTANSTMTLSFIIFESVVLLLCLFVLYFPRIVLKMVTPGFSETQIAYAIPVLKIMFPFLFFISSSALLSGALQAKDLFFAQSFGPVLHNIVYTGTLAYCLLFHKSVTTLATGILIGGSLIFALHLFIYFKNSFGFGSITKEAKQQFSHILKKFFPCLIGVGIVEINLYLDNVVSSYLPSGSYTLLYVSNRYLNLPLGIFAIAFSTILLPHFSRIASYAPKRLHFYLLETVKFITWAITPAMLFIFFVSEPLFTLILPDPTRIPEATSILICYASGLLFFCFNKVFINMFYSMHDTWSPTVASIVCAIVNLIFNIIGMHFFGSPGIAASTAISGLTLTVIALFFFNKKHQFKMYWGNFLLFLSRYLLQLAAGVVLFFLANKLIENLVGSSKIGPVPLLFLFTIPIFLSTMSFMFLTKKFFKLDLYFLKK